MWIPYNPNPRGRMVGDCTIRALTKATGKSWYDVYTGVSLDGYQLADMMSNNPNLRKLVKTIDLELNEEKETR